MVLCKKHFKNSDIEMFEGKYYKVITTYSNIYDIYDIGFGVLTSAVFFHSDDDDGHRLFSNYFYTMKELRKLKLDGIDENICT